MNVLVIIPAYNEEGNLPHLLEELNQFQDRYDSVVVDDASTDQTAQIAQSHGVPVLRLAANLGIGGAVQTGFKYAIDHNYDIVVQIDGDGQHNPIWLDQVIAPIVKGEADCVIGSRYTKEKPDKNYRTPFARRVGMIFSTTILYLATGKMIYDTTSGFRALNRKAFIYFSNAYPVDHPEAEALLMLHQAGFKIVEVPIEMRGRRSGSSLFTWIKAVSYPFRVVVGFIGLILKSRR